MNRDEMVSVVESYINGLGSRDFSQVPFSEDLTLEGPLRQKVRGQEAIHFLSGLFPVMRGTEVIQHIVEGEYVASLFVLPGFSIVLPPRFREPGRRIPRRPRYQWEG